MEIFGYDPVQWEPRQWLADTLAQRESARTDHLIVLLAHQAAWPPWSLAWLCEALAEHPQPLTIVTDLGQFSPAVWQSWKTLQTFLAWRAWALMAVPVAQWRSYARTLGVSPVSLEEGQWVVLPS